MHEPVSLHSQAMDRMYRHQRHLYDVSRKFYLLGRDRLVDQLRPPPGGQVLELGCGTGRNLIAAARRYPLSRFHGCDISGEMLKTAAAAVARAGLGDRINLTLGDATHFNPRFAFHRNSFDRVYFSYTLSMIPAWLQAIDCALGLLAPEGELHVVDFGQCEGLPQPFRRVLYSWLSLFHVSPRAALTSVLASKASAHHHQLRFQPLYRGYAWHAVVRSL